jgi:hypothetical protein
MSCPNCREEHLLMHDAKSGKFRANWRGVRKQFHDIGDPSEGMKLTSKKPVTQSKAVKGCKKEPTERSMKQGWVQCENCDCWRVLAPGVLNWKGVFVCQMDDWSPARDKTARICVPVFGDDEASSTFSGGHKAPSRLEDLFPAHVSDYKTFLDGISQVHTELSGISEQTRPSVLCEGAGEGDLTIARRNLRQQIEKLASANRLLPPKLSVQNPDGDVHRRLCLIARRVPFFVRALWAMLANRSTQAAM